MPITFSRTSYAGSYNPFWRAERKILPGGFDLVQTFPVGTVLRKGTFIAITDAENLKAAVVKVAQVVDGGTTTKPRVSKGGNFVVGDIVMALGTTDKSPMIKSIDTSNDDYDVIELSAAITGLSKGAYLQEATEYVAAVGEAAAVPATPKYVANAVLAEEKEIKAIGFATLDVSYSAVLLKDIVPPFPSDWLQTNGFGLATNHQIIYIYQ